MIKKEYLWGCIILLGIYILFLNKCFNPLPPQYNNTDSDTLNHITDTVIIHSVDTITLPPVIRTIAGKVPEPVIIYDTVYRYDNSIVTNLNKYTVIVKDSLLDGTISSEIDGVLVSQVFNYKSLFPKYIVRTDSIMVNSTTTINKKKAYLFAGGEIGGNISSFNISPVIGITTKKDYIFAYRYGLMDKTHNIIFTGKITFR